MKLGRHNVGCCQHGTHSVVAFSTGLPRKFRVGFGAEQGVQLVESFATVEEMGVRDGPMKIVGGLHRDTVVVQSCGQVHGFGVGVKSAIHVLHAVEDVPLVVGVVNDVFVEGTEFRQFVDVGVEKMNFRKRGGFEQTQVRTATNDSHQFEVGGGEDGHEVGEKWEMWIVVVGAGEDGGPGGVNVCVPLGERRWM